MMTIEKLLAGDISIRPYDRELYKRIKSRWDELAKPLDSMGAFEEITSRIGAVLNDEDIDISKKAVIVMCADNGVVKEGISQSGQEVTLAVAKAMALKTSSVCRMAKLSGIDVIPVDIGINTDEKVNGLISKKVSKGTANFAEEPAMSEEELLRAIETGIEMVCSAKKDGYRLICTGEMGIGNTTTTAAIASALLKCPASVTVGRGAGLGNDALKKKERVVADALKKYDLYNADVLTIMRSVGGFDIAGMAGVMIGGAFCGIPVIIDGVISSVSALCAVRLFPLVREYIIGSHMSNEPAAKEILKEIQSEPVINARMALGEGTGAVMLCNLIDTALALYKDVLSFDDISIEKYTRFDGE